MTLTKLDEKAGYAWVTDTHYEQPQKIKTARLTKTRVSKGNYFATENTFYYFKFMRKLQLIIEQASKYLKKIL